MNKIERLQWDKFIKGQIVFSILPWIIVLIYILFLRDPSEPFIWEFVIWAVLFTAFLVILYIVRRLYLGLLMMQELDFQAVYELDKRPEKPKNQKHNLILWLNLCFYDGYVQKTKEACEKLLTLPLKPQEEYDTHHAKIMTDFLCGDTANLETAIAQQKERASQKGIKIGSADAYYRFIQLYLQEEYAQAVEAISEVFNDEIIKINNLKKVTALSLAYMAFEKMGDAEQMQTCKENILQADPHFRTVFSRRFLGK